MIEINSNTISLDSLFCNNKKEAVMACCNYQCKQFGLLCGDQTCMCQSHDSCTLIKVGELIKIIQKHQPTSSPYYKEAVQTIFQIYDDAINYFKQKRQEFQEKLKKSDFQFHNFLEALRKRQTEKITGKRINEIILKSKSESIPSLSLETSNFYIQKKLQIMNQLKRLSQKITVKTKDWKSSLNSVITDKQDVIFLMPYLHKQNVKFNLLYRASEHNYNSQVFRSKCLQVRNVLTVVVTDEGKKYAAYLEDGWFEPQIKTCELDCQHCQYNATQIMMQVKCNAFVLNLSQKIQFPCYRVDQQATRNVEQAYNYMTGPTIDYCQKQFIFDISSKNQDFPKGDISYSEEVASLGVQRVQISFRVKDYEVFEIV